MNDDQLDDLKQFISATVSQSEQRLGDRIDKVDNRIDKLEQKVDDLDAKIDTIADTLNETLQNHEQRITKLETS